MSTRRDFLKGVLAGGAVATAAAVSEPATARETKKRPPDALGLLYDATLCVGCKACVPNDIRESVNRFRGRVLTAIG